MSLSFPVLKDTCDFTSLQLPIVRQSNGNTAVIIYGNNLIVYDKMGLVGTFVSKEIGQDALFIIFYDNDGNAINRDGNLQIPGDFRDVSIVSDNSGGIFIAAIVELSNSFPISFYGTSGNDEILLTNNTPGVEIVFVARFGSATEDSINQSGDLWTWIRTANIILPDGGSISALDIISTINLNIYADTGVLLSVCAMGDLAFFSGDVKIVNEVDGSSFSTYTLDFTFGTVISVRGLLSTTGLTDFDSTTRSFLGNLISAATVVDSTNGRYFQTIGADQGIALPNNYKSIVSYVLNPFSNSAVYSLYFTGFFLGNASVVYDMDTFECMLNFQDNSHLYLAVLCKRTDTNYTLPYEIASSAGVVTSISPADIEATNGYALFFFFIDSNRALSLINIYSFSGAGATVNLNRIGAVIRFREATSANMILEINGIVQINTYSVSDGIAEKISATTTSEEPGVVWFPTPFSAAVGATTPKAVIASDLIGQVTGGVTVAALYSEVTPSNEVTVGDEVIFTYDETTPAVYAIMVLNTNEITSPWVGWTITLFVLGCIMVVITVLLIVVNMYTNIKEGYKNEYPTL